jgi:hypothetical protein
MSRLILEPRQHGSVDPSPFETDLADLVEESFTRGVHDLPGLVAALNASPLRPPGASAWTEDGFKAVLRELGC